MPIIGEGIDHGAEVVALYRPDRPAFIRPNRITAGVDNAGGSSQYQHQGDFKEQPLPFCVQISPAYFDDNHLGRAHGFAPLRNITRPVHPRPDS